MIVAARTATTIGVSKLICFFVTTLSRKYFVDAGRTNPETRLIVISSSPSARTPRRGWIIAQTSGSAFHTLVLAGLAPGSLESVAMLYRGWSALIVGCLWPMRNYKLLRNEFSSNFTNSSGWEPAGVVRQSAPAVPRGAAA